MQKFSFCSICKRLDELIWFKRLKRRFFRLNDDVPNSILPNPKPTLYNSCP